MQQPSGGREQITYALLTTGTGTSATEQDQESNTAVSLSSQPEDGEQTDAFAWAPISQLVGLEVQPGAPGEALVLLNVDDRMHNPMGFVHGGMISLLCDAAMGIAFGRTLDEKHGFATIEMKVSYVRPVKQTRLTARARLIQRGLRIGFVECCVTDSRGKTIATASCSCTVNTL